MKSLVSICTVLIAVLISIVLMGGSPNPAQQKQGKSKQAQIDRGKYLVTICACNDCHTPKVMTPQGPALDEKRLLSGSPANDTLPPIPPGLIAPDKWGGMTNNHLTAWAGPWGKSFARNLTPDTTTGIGSWTEAIFIKAIRTGKDMGEGRDILPPMPWQMYRNLTDDDLKAVFAFLRSIPPVDNAVPDPISPTGERIPTMKMK